MLSAIWHHGLLGQGNFVWGNLHLTQFLGVARYNLAPVSHSSGASISPLHVPSASLPEMSLSTSSIFLSTWARLSWILFLFNHLFSMFWCCSQEAMPAIHTQHRLVSIRKYERALSRLAMKKPLWCLLATKQVKHTLVFTAGNHFKRAPRCVLGRRYMSNLLVLWNSKCTKDFQACWIWK